MEEIKLICFKTSSKCTSFCQKLKQGALEDSEGARMSKKVLVDILSTDGNVATKQVHHEEESSISSLGSQSETSGRSND